MPKSVYGRIRDEPQRQLQSCSLDIWICILERQQCDLKLEPRTARAIHNLHLPTGVSAWSALTTLSAFHSM